MKQALLSLYFLLFSVSLLSAQVQQMVPTPPTTNYPGGVPGAEVWYKTTFEDLDNGTYRDYSGNEVRITDCKPLDKELFNFNPSIMSDKLCLVFASQLEEDNNHNFFIVSDPKDNEESYRHLTTDLMGNQNDSLSRNKYVLETQQGYASGLYRGFNQHQNTHVHFYSWSNYDQEKLFKSYGQRGESLYFIGRHFPFEPVPDGLDFNGLMPEFVLYDRKLTDNERNRVDSYLAFKYGITLDKERDYKNSRNKIFWDRQNNNFFRNNIFGIGRDDISGLYQLQCESAHKRDYLVAATYEMAHTNEEVKSHYSIGNNNFLAFGDTGDKGLRSPNDLNLRLLRNVWLAQTTGDDIRGHVPIHFRLYLNEEFQPYFNALHSGDLVMWMLHDKYTDNSYVSDFDNGNVEFYKATDLDFQNNGKVYAHWKDEAMFDRDQSFFDQYTFAIGPEIIVQVRYKRWQCKTDCYAVEIVVQGGKPDYHVDLTDESGNPVDVGEYYIEDGNKFIYPVKKVCGDQTYTVKVVDQNGATVDYSFFVEANNNALDLGPSEQALTGQQTEIELDAGQGIQDPDATYQWTFNGEQIYYNGSTLLAEEPGEYCVTVTTSDMVCQLKDCVRVYTKLDAKVEGISECNEEESYVHVDIEVGAPPYSINITGNGLDFTQVQVVNTFDIPNIPPGNYQVTIEDQVGAVLQENIVIGNSPVVNGSLGPDQTLTATQPQITLDGPAPFGTSANGTYQWYRDGELLAETSAQLIVDTPGEYKVLVDLPDNECNGEATINVTHDFSVELNYSGGCDVALNTVEVLVNYGIPDYETTITGNLPNGDPYVYIQSHGGDISISDLPFGQFTVSVEDEYGGSYQEDIEFEGFGLNIHEQLEDIVAQCGGWINYESCLDDIPLALPQNTASGACSTFTLDASQLITANANVSYEWLITNNSLGITTPTITFEADAYCYSGEEPNYDPNYGCGGLPVFTVVVTDNDTGCSFSQSFATRFWCPLRDGSTDRPGGGGADLVTKVYPNPSGQGATFYYDVSSEEDFEGTVVLYDMNGRKIKELEISGQATYTLPFNLIASGVYLIVTQTQGKLTTDRIIIE